MIPVNINELNNLLQESYPSLSKKMKLIAFYIIDQPQNLAINTLAVIASDIGVYPSTLVRFAKHFGFSGFAELQSLFKVRISQTAINYQQRITDVKNITEGDSTTNSSNIFYDVTRRNVEATQLLAENIDIDLIEDAVLALCQAREVILCGTNRAQPVANYFYYMLNNLGIRCRIANDSNEVENLSNWLDEKTLFIAITYNPYNEKTTQAVRTAKQSNSKVILLTDTELNPIANMADFLFSIHEAEIHTFRSLGATMCLVQAICISIGYHQQGN
jgi:DNA-binding MurR/RpiR family transcriptional regulator